MGAFTRTQLEEQLRFRMGNRTDIGTQLTEAIQFAYDELVVSIRIPETQETAVLSTVDGQSVYPSPADLYFPISLRNTTDGERIDPITIRQYERIKGTSAKDKPKFYIWWRNELIFEPRSDATIRTIRMRYHKRLAALSLAATISALPREWDEVVVQGGFFRLLRWLQLKTEAQAEEAEYIQMVTRRMDRLAQSSFDRETTAEPVLTNSTSISRG